MARLGRGALGTVDASSRTRSYPVRGTLPSRSLEARGVLPGGDLSPHSGPVPRRPAHVPVSASPPTCASARVQPLLGRSRPATSRFLPRYAPANSLCGPTPGTSDRLACRGDMMHVPCHEVSRCRATGYERLVARRGCKNQLLHATCCSAQESCHGVVSEYSLMPEAARCCSVLALRSEESLTSPPGSVSECSLAGGCRLD